MVAKIWGLKDCALHELPKLAGLIGAKCVVEVRAIVMAAIERVLPDKVDPIN
ncbi:MAG: hypothetical protein LCH59_13695 [Proteobacteria bacterium]|nr:hypothetical protein [Pseudomonadota bacterium]